MDPEKTQITSNIHEPSTTSRTKVTAIIGVLLAISIIVVGGIFFLGWRQLHIENVTLKQQTTSLKENFMRSQQDAFMLKQSLINQLNAQQKKVDDLQTTLVKLSKTRTDKSADWLMDEAAYLIRLANYTLLFEKNVPLGIKLLSLASDSLQTLSDSQSLALKQNLADDIATLKNIPYPNIENTYFQLSTLDTLINKLPFPEPQKSTMKPTSKLNQSWQENFKNSLEKLRGLIVIRRYDTIAPTSLDKKQINALYQAMHLHVATAQFAFMQKQQLIYQESLKQIQSWINRYFDKNNEATQEILSIIDQLLQINVTPNIPLIHSPNFLKQERQTPNTNKTTPKSLSNKPAESPAQRAIQL